MPAATPPRDDRQAMTRGLLGRCPNCGQGRLFDGYLAIVRQCSACQEPLGRYRAADGPAFFTMSIVGLLLIPVLWVGFLLLRSDPLMLALVVTGLIGLLTLVVLRLVKGAFVGHLWAREETDRGA